MNRRYGDDRDEFLEDLIDEILGEPHRPPPLELQERETVTYEAGSWQRTAEDIWNLPEPGKNTGMWG